MSSVPSNQRHQNNSVEAVNAVSVESRRRGAEDGQSTVEYALVLVGVGALATFVFKWLAGSGLLEQLFGSIIKELMAR